MGKNDISNKKLGIISFNYREGDLFVLIMFIAAIKFVILNEVQYSIFFLLMIMWKEINRLVLIKEGTKS